MADCCISPVGCVKDIGKSIITQCLWPPIKRHIDYWWCFDNNIDHLGDEIRGLERETFDMNQKMEKARLHAEKLRPGVKEWSQTGTKKLAEARTIRQDENIPKAWNLISRYSMGKRAKKEAEEISKHRNDGNFSMISDPACPPSMGFTSHRQILKFTSRRLIEEEIIESLRSSSVSMIGICGMGGVGKTTMVQSIRERVMKEKLFNEVVIVVVSQQIDMIKIQKEIAELFGLKFDVESMSARAHQLHTRLMDEKTKIIILDDVWERLKFEDLGIPFESEFERCKILLTTRFRDVCETMEAQKIIPMEILTEEEAWILFKEKTGECVEDSTLLSVAKDVVAECKGLPVALVTVGKALQNRGKSIWVDSLSQLRRSNPTDFPEVLGDVYKPLKLSYDYLDNERERLLFLLCCLFPEDYNISVEQLTWYSMGLRIFDDITNIEEVRNRTHRLVEKLKRRFLLIDGRSEIYVKMHDVVRDVSIYIGSKEKSGFLKSLDNISIENSFDVNCNWMSVDISNESMNVPMGLCFPKLCVLMLLNSSSNQVSNKFLEGMEVLNVLSFSNISIRSLPPTLGLLQNLRTLYLYRCKIENISVIGELSGLEILSCHECNDIKELPVEIGRLKKLRLLELRNCKSLTTIAFGIISSLVRLEELKIRGSFSKWETGGERRNAAVTELGYGYLPNLSWLEIEIDDWNLAAQDVCLSPKLVKYCINFVDRGNDYLEEVRDYEKGMNLKLPSEIGAVGNWIGLLVRNADYLKLEGDGTSNINLEECQNLRNLVIWNCSTLKKLVMKFPLLERLRLWRLENLEEMIWDGTIILNQNVSLCNLKSVVIENCSKLRYLFSVSVATTSLLQLEFLHIQYCKKLEGVFWNEMRDGCIEFPKLKTLRLWYLPNLTAFCEGLENIIKFPNLTEMDIRELPKLIRLSHLTSDCKSGIAFPLLERLRLEGVGNLEEMIWDGTIILNQNVSLCNLKSIYISECSKLRYLLSVSVARTSLLQLEDLEIRFCRAMEGVFWNEMRDGCIEFPKLKTLRLNRLPNLTAFCQGLENIIKFPNLTEMELYGDLRKLNSFCPLNSEAHNDDISFHFVCNQKVEIGGLKNLELWALGDNIRNIWCHQIPMNFFNNLQELGIYILTGIRSLMSTSIAKNLVSLKALKIYRCKEMVEVIEGDDREVIDITRLLPTLKKLSIEDLRKLRRFWQWNHALELPLLEEVKIIDCPVMETFTLGSLQTPSIKSLTINKKEIDDNKDLNRAIRDWFEDVYDGLAELFMDPESSRE